MEILDKLPNDDPYDVVFIDADKKMYLEYYETILANNLVKVGGLIIVDNVLFRGMVAEVTEKEDDEACNDAAAPLSSSSPSSPTSSSSTREEKTHKRHMKIAKALHEFNGAVAADERTESVLLPIRDGLTITRRRI
uniref:Caffeoyl-CoA O-methyltransferase n=1 Tax=Lotharella oceanica TaxID=641309 RepID=A0A7S2U0F1_9EUKA|mmetsp:Transcript_4337/g.8695  ORF Transcript_4337/g.8695 Transcript_4337/m.8695 type:complete len:136 (+) Transcript_4337:641-1048(+)